MKSASKSASRKNILALPVLSLMLLAGLSGNATAQTGGIGTPSNSNPSAAEVIPNPVNPNSGQSSFSDTDTRSTPGSRPFPESSRTDTRSSEFYRSARPGIVGSDANQGERPAYVPQRQVAPTNRSDAGSANNTSTNTSQAPQTQAPQAPQSAPDIKINSDTSEQPTINIILPTASPEPVSDAEDPLGRDRVYQDVIVNDRDDDDAADMTLWAIWGGLALVLAAFASFATWWVIKRRREAGYGQY